MAPDTRSYYLKRAAQSARLGKLTDAIDLYEAALACEPKDWATANLLGDLYVKLGDEDSAARHLAHAADFLAREGWLAKASALYKKALRIRPTDDAAWIRAAELAEAQDLKADVDHFLSRAAACRRARGDEVGARALEERAAAPSSVATPAPVVPQSSRPPVDAVAPEPGGAASEPGTTYDEIERLSADAAYLTGRETVAILASVGICDAPDGSSASTPNLDWRAVVAEALPPGERPVRRVDPPAGDGLDTVRALVCDLTHAAAREALVRGVDLDAADRREEALASFAIAGLSVQCRFEAASRIGRHYLAANDPESALAWLERAVECASERTDAAHALVFDIGRALEALNEDARALAVYCDLERETGSYGDLRARIERLSGL